MNKYLFSLKFIGVTIIIQSSHLLHSLVPYLLQLPSIIIINLLQLTCMCLASYGVFGQVGGKEGESEDLYIADCVIILA